MLLFPSDKCPSRAFFDLGSCYHSIIATALGGAVCFAASVWLDCPYFVALSFLMIERLTPRTIEYDSVCVTVGHTAMMLRLSLHICSFYLP